jgi:AcrR family transcriptional regulator
MSRDHLDTPIRAALVEAAARLIATEGQRSLTLRRLADEVGTSTMAIYTNFGGMPELRRAVRREGFGRLAARLVTVETTDDPVADLAMLGLAYYTSGTTDPDLYRVMFLEHPLDPNDQAIGWETFDSLVAGVQRCMASGRFKGEDAKGLATQMWAIAHGLITLELAGLLSPQEARNSLAAAALNLFTGSGDTPDAAATSLATASARARAVTTRNGGRSRGR